MQSATFQHIPVLADATLAALAPRPGGRYIDATLGGAGHATAVLQQAQPGGTLLGIDADPAALAAAEDRLRSHGFPESSYRLQHGNFVALAEHARAHGFEGVDGILFDLGVSSHQLDTAERGFSFSHDGPLDMRLDPTQGPTAADLVNKSEETELADLIYQYGEERFSRRVARRIVERRSERPFETTADLAEVVSRAVGRGRERIHPATRTFQGLRIAVNRELAHLEAVLPQALDLLAPGGRLAVISFHSLEDRIVKLFLRAESGYRGNYAEPKPARLQLITRRPIVADDDEIARNPRSRSAKLRVAERLSADQSEGVH